MNIRFESDTLYYGDCIEKGESQNYILSIRTNVREKLENRL